MSQVTESIFGNTYIQDIMAGGAAGVLNVYATQPFMIAKLRTQKNQKVLMSPKVLWSGSCAMSVGDFTVLATQNVFFKNFQLALVEANMGTAGTLLAGGIAGITSSIPLTISEVIIDQHQTRRDTWEKAKKFDKTLRAPSYYPTLKAIWRTQGPKGFFLGFKCTCMRETIFTLACKNWADQMTNLYEQRIPDQRIAQICGGMSAGILGATLSHPFDTAKVMYQNGTAKDYLNFLKMMYRDDLQKMESSKAIHKLTSVVMKEAFKGFPARAIMVAITVPIVNISTQFFTKGLESLANSPK